MATEKQAAAETSARVANKGKKCKPAGAIATLDDPNLVSSAGLIPVLALSQRAGSARSSWP